MKLIRQKLIRIGNSVGVTIPQRMLNLQKNTDGYILLCILEEQDRKRIEE